VLCDTNGGTLPDEVGPIIDEVRAAVATPLGVHFHNDSGCAVANSILAVTHGVVQVQGCINGYGERTGNANLVPVIAGLSLKRGIPTIPEQNLELLTPIARHIAEITNQPLAAQSPYVGSSAFAHKAGLHVSALARRRDAYEHVDPARVGNVSRFVVSEMAGRQNIHLKAAEFGIELSKEQVIELLGTLKSLEHRGYHFEAADGSLELLMRRAAGWELPDLTVESYRTISDCSQRGTRATEATVKVVVQGRRVIATGEGNGPVNALDAALRKALGTRYVGLGRLHLTDYRVRVLDSQKGTGAVTRVLLDTTDGEVSWSTIGVSENIIEASWQALADSIVFGLLRTTGQAGDAPLAAPATPSSPSVVKEPQKP